MASVALRAVGEIVALKILRHERDGAINFGAEISWISRPIGLIASAESEKNLEQLVSWRGEMLCCCLFVSPLFPSSNQDQPKLDKT